MFVWFKDLTYGGFVESWATILENLDTDQKQALDDDDQSSMGSDSDDTQLVELLPPVPPAASASSSSSSAPTLVPGTASVPTQATTPPPPHTPKFRVIAPEGIWITASGDVMHTGSKHPVAKLYTTMGKTWRCKCLLHKGSGTTKECQWEGGLVPNMSTWHCE